MIPKNIIPMIALAVLTTILFVGCGNSESARIEIDFSTIADWKYMLGVDLYGTPLDRDSEENFTGSLRAYLRGMPGAGGAGPLTCGFTDVSLSAPFLPEDEREDIERRLSDLRVSISEKGVTLSDTSGIPGVYAGGWDILRSPARVIPALPNAVMSVGSSWEREQRFPLHVPQGEADGLMYQLYTLDSLYKTPTGTPVAAISWVFTYRVAMSGDGEERGQRRSPLVGQGRGNALLDLRKKKLIQSKATFQVTHSGVRGMEINEVVHFEMIE
ncbi:MAG: hypothetical protein LBC70_01745 [Chitinispirillales bacterium]|nr:hypothetical protein [Chitinispirillales bacterium]